MTFPMPLAQDLAAERAHELQAAASAYRLARLVRLSRRADRAAQPVADDVTSRSTPLPRAA
ncbi:MAG: hypothetical protein ACRD29_03780 [Acidimicrobiales bacterium]